MIFDCDRKVAGPLIGGMARGEVRQLLGKFSEFRKASFSVNTADCFEDVGAHVFYSQDNSIRGVEIFRGSTVRVQGIDIFALSFPELMSAMAGAGVKFQIDEVGARLVDLGIGLYVPDLGDVDSPSIEAVYIEMQ